jgi:hypothetical protein
MEPNIFTSAYTAVSETGIATACIAETMKNATIDVALSALCPFQLEIERHMALEHEQISMLFGGLAIACYPEGFYENILQSYSIMAKTLLLIGATSTLSNLCNSDYKNPLETLGQLPCCLREDTTEIPSATT